MLIVFGLALYISHHAGLPEKPDGSADELPAVALGWPFLFHVVRASVLLGSISVVLLVGWRASNGEFPIRFGQLEYASRRTAGRAQDATASFERRVQALEALQGIRSPADIEDDHAQS